MDAFRPRLFSRAVAAAAVLATLGIASPAAAEVADPPADIAVSASLGSCKATSARRVCDINVSFGAVPRADSYETVITAPDGALLLTVGSQPGSSTYSVTYRGNGTYGVRVTAFGD